MHVLQCAPSEPLRPFPPGLDSGRLQRKVPLPPSQQGLRRGGTWSRGWCVSEETFAVLSSPPPPSTGSLEASPRALEGASGPAGLWSVCFVWGGENQVPRAYAELSTSEPHPQPFVGQDLCVAQAVFKLMINSCLHFLRAVICYYVFWGLIFIYYYPCTW